VSLTIDVQGHDRAAQASCAIGDGPLPPAPWGTGTKQQSIEMLTPRESQEVVEDRSCDRIFVRSLLDGNDRNIEETRVIWMASPADHAEAPYYADLVDDDQRELLGLGSGGAL
jgi:hypothetical protein